MNLFIDWLIRSKVLAILNYSKQCSSQVLERLLANIGLSSYCVLITDTFFRVMQCVGQLWPVTKIGIALVRHHRPELSNYVLS